MLNIIKSIWHIKKISDISNKHECNVISNLLNPTKYAKPNHSSLILLRCMNSRSGRWKFRNFMILLEHSSKIFMDNLTSKLKQKEAATTMWETQSGIFKTLNKLNIDFCLPKFSMKKMGCGNVILVIPLKVGIISSYVET